MFRLITSYSNGYDGSMMSESIISAVAIHSDQVSDGLLTLDVFENYFNHPVGGKVL